jgi:hypothetical protein
MAVSIELGADAGTTRPWAAAHRLRLAFAAVLAALIVAGFYPPVIGPLLHGENHMSPVARVHAVVFFAWVVLLMVQIALVGARRVRWHRTLGVAGALLAVAMVVMGVLASLGLLKRGIDAGNADAAKSFLLTPLLEITVFAVLAGSAIALRQRPETHRRLMLVASVGLTYAGTGRLFEQFDPAGWWTAVGNDLLIALLMLQDRFTRGSVHPAYWIGLAVLLLGHWVEQTFNHSETWMAMANWIAEHT